MKKNVANGSSTERGFRVQVRDPHFTHVNPCLLDDGIVGPEWRDVSFRTGANPAGVPVLRRGDEYGLMSYEGATALAWTLIAQNRFNMLECRLVAYTLQCSFTLEKDGAIEMHVIKDVRYSDISIEKEVEETQKPAPEA